MKGLFEYAKEITEAHARRLIEDPSLAKRLDADIEAVTTEGERIARAWERRQKVVDLERERRRFVDEGREP